MKLKRILSFHAHHPQTRPRRSWQNFRLNTALTGAAYTNQWSTTLAPEGWMSFTPASETSDDVSPVETVTITLDGDLLIHPKRFVRVVATDE